MGADENVAATYYSHLIIYVLHVSVKHYETQIDLKARCRRESKQNDRHPKDIPILLHRDTSHTSSSSSSF